MRFMTRVSVVWVAFLGALVGFGLSATPAYASKAVHANVGSQCSGQEMISATFTLTQVESGQKITVNTWHSHDHAHDTYNPSTRTATYTVALDGPLASPAAVASVPDDWSGSFTVKVQCAAPKPPSVSHRVSVCNAGPLEIAVTVKNNNAQGAEYTVSLGGVNKTVPLAAGESDQVSFNPSERGTTYTLRVTSSGVNVTQQVMVEACQALAPPPAPKKPNNKGSQGTNGGASTEDTATTEPSPSGSESPSAMPSEPPSHDDNRSWLSYLNDPFVWIGSVCCLLVFGGVGLLVWILARRRAPATATP